MLKIPKGPSIQNFRHYETVQNSHFLFFRIFFEDSLLFFQNFLMSTKGPPFSLFDILHQNGCSKIPKGPFFQIFWKYETAIKICHFFREFFITDSKESPFNFLKFCNRMNVEKSQRVPSFTVSGIVTFFKSNNFRVKIRFSQVRHAISGFKRPVFFLCDF